MVYNGIYNYMHDFNEWRHLRETKMPIEMNRDFLAFIVTQMESQLQRLQSDPNYRTLGEDAKLAVGGMVKEVSRLNALLY